MNKIQIVRLKNGTDLIAEVSYDTQDKIILREPLEIFNEIDENGMKSIYFTPWLPLSMINDNIAVMREADILLYMNASDSAIEHYGKAVLNLIIDREETVLFNEDSSYDLADMYESYDEDVEEAELEEVIEVQESISKLKNITIH